MRFHCHYFFMSAALLNPLQSRFFIPCPFLFYIYKFIYFNWRLITLQYCIGFAIHQHECVHPCPFLAALTKVTDHVYIVKSDIFQSVSCLTYRQQLILLISPSFKHLSTLSSRENIVSIRGQICKQQNPFWKFKQKRNILKDVRWLTIYVGGQL